jgi:organic radical activating enzyme
MLEENNAHYLHLTFACDWYCDYCSEDTHNRKTIRFNTIKEHAEQISPNSNVTLSGGEPGLARKEHINWVINHLKEKDCSINVNTNGMFFKRYPDLCDQIDSFLYHCSEDLKEDEIYIPSFVDRQKIDFLLVITDTNMDRLGYYIDKYPDITFTVFRANFIARQDGRMGNGLSRSNAFKIYTKFKDRITPDSFVHLITNCLETSQMQNQKIILKT